MQRAGAKIVRTQRPSVLIVCLVVGAHSPSEAGVFLSANKSGVQFGGQVSFTATTDETDPVVKVTYTYEGTTQSDTTGAYSSPTPTSEITKTMNWATLEDLTVTATFDFANIADQYATVTVDVVDIALTASSSPPRGSVACYTATAQPSGVSVSSWDWSFTSTLINNEWTDTSNSDDVSTWQGKIVFGGTLTNEATVLGVVVQKALTITAQDRGSTSWNTPITCVQDNEPNWGAPVYGLGELLAETRDRNSNVAHIIVPQSTTGDWSDGVSVAQVPSGPNAGLWYVVSESLVIDQETVINRYIKSGGPPPEANFDNFYTHNSAGCLSGDMADFITAVMHHEYRGTPSTIESLEGHFGRMEYMLDHGPEHPGVAVESLVDTTQTGLIEKVNDTVGFIEFSIDAFATHGEWNEAGPNWGGEGSLGSGNHTRFEAGEGYFADCNFGPDHF